VREKYCWLVAGGWFVVREKYCWLIANKPSEQRRIKACEKEKKKSAGTPINFVQKKVSTLLYSSSAAQHTAPFIVA
jgi:hypothetical protein